MAYKTDDIEVQVKQTREGGCRLIHETPIEGAGSKLGRIYVYKIHPWRVNEVLFKKNCYPNKRA